MSVEKNQSSRIGIDKPEWMRLCEQATKEQDPEKLMQLVQEITRLLEEREKLIKSGKGARDEGSASV